MTRLEVVRELSQSGRVEGKRAFLDFDVTDLLSSSELREFREETGLERSPATLVLTDDLEEVANCAAENQVVVAFLHGMGGGRGSWGIGGATPGPQDSFVLGVLDALERLGKQALGLVLAGLGRDGGDLDPLVRQRGITPQHYSKQLELALRSLDLLKCSRIIGIGHSVGAAALWEFASGRCAEEGGEGEAKRARLDISVVAISPVRAIAESRFLSLGCQVAGKGLDLLLRPVVGLWRFSGRGLSQLTATASALKGLARQGIFNGTLAGVKGLVVIGQHDLVARVGLRKDLRRAGCQWPVAQLAGLGHNLLWHPATQRVLVSYLPSLL
jgi:pimeloyl-ACP methyl ester carboxylesterase